MTFIIWVSLACLSLVPMNTNGLVTSHPQAFLGKYYSRGKKEANKWDFVVVCAVLLSSGDIHPTIGAIPLVPLTMACASPAVPMHCVAHMER